MQPNISLVYNSQSGNGIAGYGWNIAGLSAITRTGNDVYHDGKAAPVTYTNTDGLVLDGLRLNPVSGSNGANGTTYATEAESFATITSYGTNSNNPDWFKVVSKNGSVMEFGNTADSKMLTDDGANKMMWRLNRITDINGNYIDYLYDNTDRDSRILKIRYANYTYYGDPAYCQILFEYAYRDDKNKVFENGASLANMNLLQSIRISSNWTSTTEADEADKIYWLKYAKDELYSYLQEIYMSVPLTPYLNSTTFLYGDKPADLTTYLDQGVFQNQDLFTGDFNGDGRSDVLAANVYYSNFQKHHSSYQIQYNLLTSQPYVMYEKYLPPGDIVYNTGKPYRSDNLFSSDFNSDGKDDVLYCTTSSASSSSAVAQVTGLTITFTKSFNSQTGFTDYDSTIYSMPKSAGITLKKQAGFLYPAILTVMVTRTIF